MPDKVYFRLSPPWPADPGIRFADNIREGGNHGQAYVVRFYNARDKGGFLPAEVAANADGKETGDLGMTATGENADYLESSHYHLERKSIIF
jgi:hypothetical protein